MVRLSIKIQSERADFCIGKDTIFLQLFKSYTVTSYPYTTETLSPSGDNDISNGAAGSCKES